MRIVHNIKEIRELCAMYKDLDLILKKRYPFYLFENELARIKLELSPELRSALKTGSAWKGVVVLPEDRAFELLMKAKKAKEG